MMGPRIALLLLVIAACDGASKKPPPPPPPAPATPTPTPVAAIGDLSSLAPDLQRAFTPTDADPLRRAPSGDDWLAQHPEPGQTFDQYVASRPNLPDAERRVLYLLPLGDLPTDPPMAALVEVVHAFFTLEVRVLPAVPLAAITATRRINDHTGKPQLLSPDILRWLVDRVPPDAYALMAVTMVDLYPDPEWNFVYGQASLALRVGVQSFARYDPTFFGGEPTHGWQRTLTSRTAKVMVHEIAHMFGIEHCIYWRCVVAGANHEQEFDRHPLHLCPACLRKLWWAVRFDPAAREDALAAVWQQLALDDEAAHARAAAARIRGDVPPPTAP